MKKNIIGLIMILSLIVLSGCKQTYSYVYMHDRNDIKSIDIVIAEEGKDAPIITYVTAIDENEYDQFIDELNDIEFQKYLYDEHPSIYDKQAILITYSNDDYEIITYNAQSVFFHTDLSSEPRRFYTDKETFDNWLMSYVIS